MIYQRGAVLIEYILVVAIVAILSISNLDSLETSIQTLITNISGEVDTVASSVSI